MKRIGIYQASNKLGKNVPFEIHTWNVGWRFHSHDIVRWNFRGINPMMTMRIPPPMTVSRLLNIFQERNQNFLRKHEASSDNDGNPLETMTWICDVDDAGQGAPMMRIMIGIGGQGLVDKVPCGESYGVTKVPNTMWIIVSGAEKSCLWTQVSHRALLMADIQKLHHNGLHPLTYMRRHPDTTTLPTQTCLFLFVSAPVAGGNEVGNVDLQEALAYAQHAGQDLVQLGYNPRDDIARCVIISYTAFLNRQREKKKKTPKPPKVKTARFREDINSNDILTKAKQTKKWIAKGLQVGPFLGPDNIPQCSHSHTSCMQCMKPKGVVTGTLFIYCFVLNILLVRRNTWANKIVEHT